jgi:hypothetical protein
MLLIHVISTCFYSTGPDGETAPCWTSKSSAVDLSAAFCCEMPGKFTLYVRPEGWAFVEPWIAAEVIVGTPEGEASDPPVDLKLTEHAFAATANRFAFVIGQ